MKSWKTKKNILISINSQLKDKKQNWKTDGIVDVFSKVN